MLPYYYTIPIANVCAQQNHAKVWNASSSSSSVTSSASGSKQRNYTVSQDSTLVYYPAKSKCLCIANVLTIPPRVLRSARGLELK